ncbi:MAG: murein L,D-transpeptidase YcbB/YkuD [Gammaproteobacteria bacterium]
MNIRTTAPGHQTLSCLRRWASVSLCLISSFALNAPSLALTNDAQPGEQPGEQPAEQLRAAIAQRIQIDALENRSGPSAASLAKIQANYVGAAHAPLWVSHDGPTARARELAQAISALTRDGLNPKDYDIAAISSLVAQGNGIAELADLDVRLSLALVHAASDLASGRLEPRQVNPKLYIYPQDIDHATVLAGARNEEDVAAYLQSFQPGQANYHRLKSALAHYRTLAADTSWPTIDSGDTLKRGMEDPRVGLVRSRLRLLEDLPLGTPLATAPNRYDDSVAASVRHFQARHGLDQDGKVGKNTLAALNVSPSQRVEQILLNLERRRWMPDKFEPRYVFVNLADFYLKVVENIDGRERTIHTTEVVVGKRYHQTPEFSHKIRYLVINPYWNVPVSIARNELFAKFKKDPSYIQARGYELFDGYGAGAGIVDPELIDWESLSRRDFRYKIRQRPGPENALGTIKFMFPNRHNIYLHDTPSRTLFKRTERAFSHGCIRVKDPDLLAATLLQWQSDWPTKRVRQTVADGERTVVSLAEPVPVHLAYITAWVNKNGAVHFRNDVYDRDKSLAAVLLPALSTDRTPPVTTAPSS